MRFSIKCPHDRNQSLDYHTQLPDHKPLAKSTVRKMLKMAVVANNQTVNKIHVRLTQAIPGHICPHPIDGGVAEKMRKLNAYYVRVFLADKKRVGFHANRLYALINA